MLRVKPVRRRRRWLRPQRRPAPQPNPGDAPWTGGIIASSGSLSGWQTPGLRRERPHNSCAIRQLRSRRPSNSPASLRPNSGKQCSVGRNYSRRIGRACRATDDPTVATCSGKEHSGSGHPSSRVAPPQLLLPKRKCARWSEPTFAERIDGVLKSTHAFGCRTITGRNPASRLVSCATNFAAVLSTTPLIKSATPLTRAAVFGR